MPKSNLLRAMSLLLAHALAGVLLFVGASVAQAATTTFTIGFDTDNNAATGCALIVGAQSLAGVEVALDTVVTTTTATGAVGAVTRRTCVGGNFGAPTAVSGGGWAAGMAAGTGGSDLVETFIPLANLPGATLVKIGAVTPGDGLVATQLLDLQGAPPAAGATPIPMLSPVALVVLFLSLASTGWLLRRYAREGGTALFMLCMFALTLTTVSAWAIVRDGNGADWTGIAPLGTDPMGDAAAGDDLVALFAVKDGGNVSLRVDVVLARDASANQPPVVNAGANQTITLPAGATLNGSATDDALPNPPGALTLTWSKSSGPGTVTFGNAALAATTATFSAAGTYVLRLSAFDGALTGSANVTITVNPGGGGGANQPPTVNAGADQTITLPAAATLAGTVTDDGLPNPPSTLNIAWSYVSGPVAGVVFGNPAAPGTTATFAAPGVYLLRLTADDGALSANSTVQVTVIDGAPQLAAIADRTIESGSRLQVLLQGKDGNGNDVLTYALTTAPAGASLNPAPLIDWVPTVAQVGTHPFTAQVTDSSGKTATASFNVTVVHTNHAPQLAPQASLSMAVGTAFARTLTASDADAADALAFALVAGPGGMTLSGANLDWSTSGRNPGDYVVTVKVTDAGGLSDQKTFTITLTGAAPGPLAKDDSFTVKVAHTLTVPAAGVLANDIYSGTGALTATKLTNPDAGGITAFNGDGSFTYQAPATAPRAPLTMAKEWSVGVGSDRYHELVADLNGDGYPDIVTFDNNALARAFSGLDGSQLWGIDRTGAFDCSVNSGAGSMDSRVLADLDDSGHPALAYTTFCSREGSSWQDNIVAVDHLGHVKWVSPPLSKPNPDIVRGATPPPPGGFTPGGVAYQSGLSVARLTAGGPPVLLMRQEIPRNWGFSTYVDAANVFHYSGCRAVTGLAADENVACRATFIISGTNGSVLQTLVVRNPAVTDAFYGSGPNSFFNLPPIAMDIDGDGRVDLVSGSEVWMQNAGGGFDFAWQLSTSVTDTAVADLDGDGKAEIIHLRASGFAEDLRGIFIYSSDGQLKRRIPFQGFWITPLTIADVDGDGRSDIVLGADGTLYAFRDDGRPMWAYQVPPDIPDNPVFAPFYVQPTQSSALGNAAPQVYDLDGDGVAEVVFSAYSRIIVLDGRKGVRKLNPYWTYNFSYHDISALMLLDMNNDGHVDIVQNSSFIFNCLFVGADFLTECIHLIGPTALSGGGTNNWLPGPKAFPHVQYRSTAIDNKSRVLHDTTVSRIFRTPAQQGTVRDPRLAQATSFTYSASDGAATSAPASVFIDIVPDNRPPVFTSVPPTSLLQSTPNFYDVTAIDPDAGDTITFSLKQAPFWVTMSGPARLSFAPFVPWGLATVIVTATDSLGASTDQIFIVNATTTPATVPNVTGMQFEAAKTALLANDLQGVRWAEQFAAQPVGTVLGQDPPAGTVVGRLADIHLTVSKGLQPVTMPFVVGQQLATANSILTNAGLTVNVATIFSNTIPAGEITKQSPVAGTLLTPATAPPVDLTVSAGGALSAPVASIFLKPGPGPLSRLAGDEFQFKAVAILTDGTSADVTLKTAWSTTNATAATVDGTGFVRAKASGSSTIVATLSGKTGQVPVNVSPLAPGDNTPPIAAITSPADGADVIGPVPVAGTASDANFLRYELAISPAGDDAWTLLGEGTAPVTNGPLGTLDPTTLLNDLYTLRLTVFDKGGNTAVATASVQLRGDRKVGLFSLTYLDLNVPAAGIPLTVSRTYDSRDKAQGDFGVGWRLGLQTLRIRTNRVLGTGWVRIVSGPTVSLVPTSEHRVSITLPDGRVEMFDMVVSPTSNIGSLDFTNVTGFTPRLGTLGKLQALVNNSLLIVDGGAEVELVDDSTIDTYNPALYRYTTVDGTQIEISPGGGVKKVTDPNGNAVTFGAAGILHSNGKGIVFTRDAKGRIAAITDLLGNVQTYSYDGNGDLVTHTNPVGGVSHFAYDSQHGLVEIRDASGNRAARNEYDASGRLIAVIDANGNRVTFSHDDAALEDVVTDRLGGVLRLHYDASGNILGTEQGVTIEGTLVNAVTTMTYDAQNNETSRIDPDGKRLDVTYSGVMPTAKVIDPSGLNLRSTFAYNARNDATAAVDSGGRSYAFTYDANGNLLSFDAPDIGTGTSLSSAQGLLAQRTDALGTTTTMTRDAAGNVTREDVRDASNVLLRRIDFTYDANGNKRSQTLYRTIAGVSTPLVTQFGYDAANRLVSVTNPSGGVTRTEYDGDGRPTAVIDALGRRVTFSYDSFGRRIRTTFADATSESVSYDANGNVVTQTDRAGRVTTLAYDELNRNISTTLQNGDTTRTIYSAAGRVAATVDANGNRTDYAYDTAGRAVGTTLPAVANGTGGPLVRPQMQRTLNGLGAPTAVTDALSRSTTFLYNPAGRLAQTNLPDGANVKQTFDALGRRTSIVNEEGQATTFTYDGLGRLVAVAGLGGDATYRYDEAGNLVSQTDALGRVTQMRYDVLNRQVEKQYPGGEIEKSVYDAVGNLVALTRPDGKTITFTYDAMGRVTRKSLPGALQVDYTYKPDGQRATVTDARGVTTYAYDGIGRLASITHPGGDVVSMTRDANGNLKSLASPAAAISYDYDALNRLVRVVAPEGQSQSFYDLAGNRVHNTLANGMATDAAFDARNRVTQLVHRTPANAILESFTTGYSPAGRRTQVAEGDGSMTLFGYDAKGRLVTETRTGNTPFAISHAYDAVGNRTQVSRPGGPVTYTYDSNDRLLSAGTTTYGYDANGNRVTKTNGANVTQYGYDAQDRLVTLFGGGAANQYSYDADGQRVMSSTPTDVTRFLPDSSNGSRLVQVLEERDGGGNLRARYSYGNELLAMARNGSSSFYLRDSLGSVRGLVDTTASLTDRYLYDGYGNTAAATGATTNPYRFAGERFDTDDSLYQLRARYYDPAAGRFVSRDPFAGRTESPVSLHRYLYANADPVNFTDPTGLDPSLLSITLTQALSSFVDSSIALKDVQQLCTAKGMADQLQSLVATSQQFIALAGLAAAGVFASELATGGLGGSIDFAYVSEDFGKESLIKNFQLQLKGSGNQLALGFQMTNHEKLSLKAAVTMLPPPLGVSLSGATKAAFERKFVYCGLAELGKIALESEVSGGAGIDGFGAFLALGWNNTIEASLFRGAINVSWPILSLTTKNNTATVNLLGLWSWSAGDR